MCLIGVFAYDIATTTPACIKDVRYSIRDVATSLPEPPTEDVYNQIMELLNRYINEASGIPSGGAKGQVLKKASDNDFDATWQDDEKGTQISEDDVLRVIKEYIEKNPPQDGFSPTVDIIPVDNGYTVNITDKNDVHSYTIYNGLNGIDGISATHTWNGTILTISSASGTSSADLKGDKGERGEQGVQGLQGVQGIQGIQGVQGEKGDKGDGFSISKTYVSVAAMNAGFYTDDVPLNGFVLINTGNVNDADNAKLFVKTLTGYSYLTDLSGSQGIKGDKGDKGDQGVQGEQGIRGEQGIQGIQGEKGEDGINGKDGNTPYILNGYWYIDGVNTNVKAEGKNGNDYVLTDDDRAEIKAEIESELSQIETPKIVSSVDEMIDTTKHYVLNGNIWAHRTVTTEGETVLVPNFTNLIKFDASGNPTNVALNKRYSGSAGAAAGYLASETGSFAITEAFDISGTPTIYINKKPTGQAKILYLVADGTTAHSNGVSTINASAWTNGANGEFVGVPSSASDAPKLKFAVNISTTAITADSLKDWIVTLNEPIIYTEQKTEGETVSEWYDTGISYAPTFKTDLIGVLGEDNVIYLSDNLPSGTYTLKYPDNNYATVGTITK
jgi:hypothetical protein